MRSLWVGWLVAGACVPRPAHQQVLADVRSLEARVDSFDQAFQEQEVNMQDAKDAAQASDADRVQLQLALEEHERALTELRERVDPMEAADERMRLWRERVEQGMSEKGLDAVRLLPTAEGLSLAVRSDLLFKPRGATLSEEGSTWLSRLGEVLAASALSSCQVELVGAATEEQVSWERLGQRADTLVDALLDAEVQASASVRSNAPDSADEQVRFRVAPSVELSAEPEPFSQELPSAEPDGMEATGAS